MRSTDTLSDFVFLKSANNICISRSSYSWCAALASSAQRVFLPLSDVDTYSENFDVDREGWVKF